MLREERGVVVVGCAKWELAAEGGRAGRGSSGRHHSGKGPEDAEHCVVLWTMFFFFFFFLFFWTDVD